MPVSSRRRPLTFCVHLFGGTAYPVLCGAYVDKAGEDDDEAEEKKNDDEHADEEQEHAFSSDTSLLQPHSSTSVDT